MTETVRRIAVVGSRTFRDLEAVRQFVREQERTTIIVSGGAPGPDTAAVEEARRLRMAYEVYPADWAQFGRRAGFLRNATIVEKADEVVAFWDGASRGTAHTIRLAEQAGKSVRIVQDGA